MPIIDSSQPQRSSEHTAQNRRRLAERWQELVHQAQTLPGMNDFFAPKKAWQLVTAARAGDMVVITLEKGACHALVIRSGSTNVACVPLQSVSYEKLTQASNQHYFQNMGGARADRKVVRHRANTLEQERKTVLKMLWNDIAKPILDYLGHTDNLPIKDLPHITWCTTGSLSFLPIHAAGDYSEPHCCVFNYVISSYTPTISALLSRSSDSTTSPGIALLGQAFTPGLPSLPGTIDELKNVSKQAERIQTTLLEGNNATCEAVLNVLERHSWAHFACHASQDAVNPTASAFHLHNGPLDLSTIAKQDLRHVELAFLSACHTATGDKKLSEEAIHLAAGMIMAGYKTVIATMWPIADQDAPLVADRFYSYILNEGAANTRNAARALHYAIGCLRESVGVKEYQRWAPYVHIGQ